MKFVCSYCGGEFSCPPSRRPCDKSYCSRECYLVDNSAQIITNCEYCGQAMSVYKSVLRKGGGKYCSMTCKGQAMSDKRLNGGYKKCVICKKHFYVKASRLATAMYCSNQCRGLGQQTGKSFNCRNCGKNFYRSPSKIAQCKTVFCSRECQLALYKHEGNPNWRGGIDPNQKRRNAELNLPSTFTEDQWEWLLDYYGHRCAYCGCSENDVGTLAREHVVPVSKGGGYTFDNIVPSCTSCNSRKHARTPVEAGLTFWKERAKIGMYA